MNFFKNIFFLSLLSISMLFVACGDDDATFIDCSVNGCPTGFSCQDGGCVQDGNGEVDSEVNELRYATVQQGQLGEKNVLIGALGGLAYKNKLTKIRLTAMHLQNGESRAGQFSIDNDGQAIGQSGYFATSDNLEYNQRSLSNLLLNGTHVLDSKGWEIDWRLSPTLSKSEDPDIRKTAFTIDPNRVSFNAGNGGNPSRIWRDLEEINAVAKVDITKKYTFKGQDAKLKFGAAHTYKNRDYKILFFLVLELACLGPAISQ